MILQLTAATTRTSRLNTKKKIDAMSNFYLSPAPTTSTKNGTFTMIQSVVDSYEGHSHK
jgi:hypothetical protein